MQDNRIILPITPQTNVTTTYNTKILFQIPLVCYKGRDGKGCMKYKREGLCKHTLSSDGRTRRKRLERYNKYKIDVLHLAKQAGFQLPTCGMSVYFFCPIPKYVPLWKRKLLHGQLKLSKPDIKNYIAAFEDALTIVDEKIAAYSGLGKYWVDTKDYSKDRFASVGPGWIEVLLNQPVYNPLSVTFVNQDLEILMRDEQVQRKKMEVALAPPKRTKKRRHVKKRNEYFKQMTGRDLVREKVLA